MGVLKNVQCGWEMFTLSVVAYVTVNFKKVISDLFQAGSTLVESECIKRKAIGVVPRLKTVPYAIQKHLAMHHSYFTCILLRSILNLAGD